jgi:hypothetical protein
MSTQPAPATDPQVVAASAEPKPPPAAGETSFRIPRTWQVAAIAAVIMVLLALVGIGLTTTTSYQVASTYWICLVPFYGLLCVATAWRWHGKHIDRPAVLRQLWHWLGIGAALALDFFIRGSGEETGVAAGLNAMLLLALGCFLAGIHLDWLFVVVGLLLAAALVVVAKADQYLWLMFLVGGIAIAAMLVYVWLLGPRLTRKGAASSPAPSVPAGS